MEDDDPDILWALLCHIYGLRAELYSEHSWQYWLELARAADKFFAPNLVKEAADAIRTHGFRFNSQSGLLWQRRWALLRRRWDM